MQTQNQYAQRTQIATPQNPNVYWRQKGVHYLTTNKDGDHFEIALPNHPNPIEKAKRAILVLEELAQSMGKYTQGTTFAVTPKGIHAIFAR